jgi:hypothetical protein
VEWTREKGTLVQAHALGFVPAKFIRTIKRAEDLTVLCTKYEALLLLAEQELGKMQKEARYVGLARHLTAKLAENRFRLLCLRAAFHGWSARTSNKTVAALKKTMLATDERFDTLMEKVQLNEKAESEWDVEAVMHEVQYAEACLVKHMEAQRLAEKCMEAQRLASQASERAAREEALKTKEEALKAQTAASKPKKQTPHINAVCKSGPEAPRTSLKAALGMIMCNKHASNFVLQVCIHKESHRYA